MYARMPVFPNISRLALVFISNSMSTGAEPCCLNPVIYCVRLGYTAMGLHFLVTACLVVRRV